jgi:hypothetical protein
VLEWETHRALGQEALAHRGILQNRQGPFRTGSLRTGDEAGSLSLAAIELDVLPALAHWGYLSQGREGLPRWGEAARTILEEALGETVIEGLLMEIEERGALLRSQGIEVRVDRCKT